MRRAVVFAVCALLAGVLPSRVGAQQAPASPGAVPGRQAATWVLQVSTGTAAQLNSRLRIDQDGEEPLDFTAHYETRPYTSGAPYYAIRLGRWVGNAAWELETHHHLVTLVDNPPEVGEFALTHGYNLNTVNRAWLASGFVWRAGAGILITHPESLVRGKQYRGEEGFSQGFSLSGVCGQLGVEKRLPLWDKLFLSLEGKFTAAWARVPIADGDATVPNYAFHALAGLGYSF